MATDLRTTALHNYIAKNPGFLRVYEAYQPNLEVIAKIRVAIPEARLVTVCEYWCGDCRRLVPRMARIAEHLPGWALETYAWDNVRRNKPWQIRAVPTFIVYRGDQEVGRIIENPSHGSLEEDLLVIAGSK